MNPQLQEGKRYLYTRPHATGLFIFMGHAESGNLLFYIIRRDGHGIPLAMSEERYRDEFCPYLTEIAPTEMK